MVPTEIRDIPQLSLAEADAVLIHCSDHNGELDQQTPADDAQLAADAAAPQLDAGSRRVLHV